MAVVFGCAPSRPASRAALDLTHRRLPIAQGGGCGAGAGQCPSQRRHWVRMLDQGVIAGVA